MANTGRRFNNALISSHPSQSCASAPIYDDDPPPYPFHEILHIGYSPKMAVINNNIVPSTHVTMPRPIVQNATINNDHFTNPTSATSNNNNSASLNVPVRSQIQRSRNIRQCRNNRNLSIYCYPCYTVAPFIIVLVVVVLMVILVLHLTVRSVGNY